MGRRGAFSVCLSLIVLCCMGLPVVAADKTVLVLDASRSMWGTIAKKPKYMMVHDAFARAIGSRPARPGIGLVSYGNHSPSSCTDINAAIAPGGSDHPRFLSTIKDIKPWGLTPIAGSLRRAAETFGDSTDRRSIILITDGTENCRGDPCAVAASLKKQSPSLAINVVALSVPEAAHKHLSCIAENTGGLFRTAGTQSELDIAVGTMIDFKPGSATEIPVAALDQAQRPMPSLALLRDPPPLPRRNPRWRKRIALIAAAKAVEEEQAGAETMPDPVTETKPELVAEPEPAAVAEAEPAKQAEPETRTAEPEAQQAPKPKPEPQVALLNPPAQEPAAPTDSKPGSVLLSAARADPIETGAIPANPGGAETPDAPIERAPSLPERPEPSKPATDAPAKSAARAGDPDQKTEPSPDHKPEFKIEDKPAPKQQGIKLSAKLTAEMRPISLPVEWSIYKVESGDQTLWKQVGAVRAAEPTMKLDPGRYLVRARYGHVTASKMVEVKPRKQSDITFVLNAGGLRILSHLIFVDAPRGKQATHFIYTGDADENGMRQLVAKSQIQGDVIALNAGRYRVISRLGEANSVVSTDVTVSPGVLTAVEVNHKAGVLSLKIDDDADAPSTAKTNLVVVDDDGNLVARARGDAVQTILAPGRYSITVERAGKKVTEDFDIRIGESKAINLNLE